MHEITKTFRFEAAHQLPGHDGQCANLHGHSYKLEVTVQGALASSGSSEGMIMDFADLKAAVKPVVDALDHSFISEGNEPPVRCGSSTGTEKLTGASYHLGKVVHVGVRTTAENLSGWIFREVERRLADKTGRDFGLLNVRLWETETGCATAYGPLPNGEGVPFGRCLYVGGKHFAQAD